MLYTVINVLCFYINSFRSMCAMSNVAVFYSFLICFPGVLLGNFLNDSEMVPVASFVAGVTSVFYILHGLCCCCCCCCKVYIFQNHFSVFLDHVSIS